MNGKMARKVRKTARKYAKANWIEYVEALKQWPFRARWRFCWHILLGKRRKKGR